MKRKKTSKLQTRFFFTYLAMACSVLLVFSVFFYNYVSRILIEQETKSLSDLTLSFGNQVEDVIRNMDSVSIDINYSAAVKQLVGEKELTLSPAILPDFTSFCVSINGAENQVAQINLYDYANHGLQVGLSTKFTATHPDNLDWIERTKSYGGHKIISEPYLNTPNSRYSSSSNWYLSLYRSYYNASGRNVGALEVVCRCKTIFKNIISYQKRTDAAPKVYVYNQKGQLLYPYTEEEADHTYPYFSKLNAKTTHMTFHNPDTKENELLAYHTSDYTGFTYVTVQKEATILTPVNHLANLLFGIIGAMILGSVLVSFYMSRSLIKPIKQLTSDVKQTELVTLGQMSPTHLSHSFIELEILNQTFQDMRSKLKISMDNLIDTREQELKSRTLALQSQINPHFYYNSLASVIVLAENEQSEEVIRMCRNLTKIMRYITDTTSSIVTLEEEIDYITKYLDCMKIRYQTSLNYMIDIDPSMNTIKIPKLIIQPLVENAIKYGMNGNPPWGIAIHGTIEENSWRIDVMDSGKGFTDESISLIKDHIAHACEHPGMPDIQINGMGMLNVYLRWKLYCKTDYLFEFKNTPSGHGIVSIGQNRKKEDFQNGNE